ncbi:MAG: FAD-dependent oxidoreductase [Candidatus Heritagella sp.]
MNFPYQKLLSPYSLTENIVLKNRIISPNVLRSHNQGPETWPADPQFAECAQLCRSGAAMFSYRHTGKFGGGSRRRGPSDNRVGLDYENTQTRNYLAQLAAQTHMLGSKILVKLEQEFPNGMSLHGGVPEFLFPAPAGFPSKLNGRTPLTREQMAANCCPKELFPQVIEEMVDLMRMYVELGFDGMSIRCDRYLDAAINLRTDEYNGPIENRARFTYELLHRMKEVFGPDFLIEGAMPGSQLHGEKGESPCGYTLEETIRFARMMEGTIDVLQIRNENMIHYHPTGYDARPHEHESLRFCRAIREAGVSMTLAAACGFVDPDEMEKALESGVCDLLSVGRELIAEPDFTKKLLLGQKPVPCIQCNKCHGDEPVSRLSTCSVNPTSGMNHRFSYTLSPSGKKKKVTVIGGGLIGMRAAVMAAELGHTVTLYEKTGYLGGKAKYADLYDFKWPIRRYREWLIGELDAKNVTVHTQCAPQPAQLQEENFDAILACTGSVAKRPPIYGAENPQIYTSEDIYEQRVLPEELGHHIVVVGGSSVSLETGMYLAQQGKAVTLISRQDSPAKDLSYAHNNLYETFMKIDPQLGYGGMRPAWEAYDGFQVILRSKTLSVTPKSVTYANQNGLVCTIECDAVVVNGGFRHCQKEALAYAGCAPEFYLAGDVEDCGGTIQLGNVSAFGKVHLL